MTTAQDFFSPYSQVPINPIQKAQDAYKAKDLPTYPNAEPEKCKHSVAQGLLLNNKAHKDYLDLQGNPINTNPGDLFQMTSVKEAMRRAYEEDNQNPNSQAYLGKNDKTLKELEPMVREVLFGAQNPLSQPDSRVATIIMRGMATSFTFLIELIQQKHPEIDTIIFGTNGYGGYLGILKKVFKNVIKYPHSKDNKFNFEGLEETIKSLEDPRKALLLLQADAYNYTGINPTPEDKKKIVKLAQETGVLPLIDSAYQGLINGLTEDTELIRLLAETDHPFIVNDSYSKKTPLYVQRLSFLHFATGSEEQAQTLRDNAFSLVRTNILSPNPAFRILYHLLKDPELTKIWKEKDIPQARSILHDTKTLMAKELGQGFEYIDPSQTQGMFNKIDISYKAIKELADKFNIHAVEAKDEDNLDPEGNPKEVARVNMGSIPLDCIPYIANAFKSVNI